VARIAETLSNGATQFGIAAGDQHLHRYDLLVFNTESR
jgi:hypothetical protein